MFEGTRKMRRRIRRARKKKKSDSERIVKITFSLNRDIPEDKKILEEIEFMSKKRKGELIRTVLYLYLSGHRAVAVKSSPVQTPEEKRKAKIGSTGVLLGGFEDE